MTQDKENILYRVFNRIIIIFYKGAEYTVRAPNSLLRYKAELYKQNIIDNYKYDLPLLNEYDRFLIQKNFIEADYEKKIQDMTDTIKKFKVDLFKCGPLIEKEKQIRITLKAMKSKLSEYVYNIEFQRKPTLEYFADNLRNKYILINTIFDKNDNLVFDSENLDTNLLDNIIDILNEHDIPVEKFREIARTSPWQDYWRANKVNLFNVPAMDMSEDQKTLLGFSRMYDSIWEHGECPSEAIIADDDKLDGFLISQQNKSENKNEKSGVPDRFDEVYITARTNEEANSIYASNSLESKRILKERAKVLKSKEQVVDLDFQDRRLDLLEQMSASESIAIRNRSR